MCPVCGLLDNCPVCGYTPKAKESGFAELRREIKMKNGDEAPELLIEIIQGRQGSVPKAEREEAITELIRRFQYLIQKVCKSLYYGYDLGKKYGYEFTDFHQDVLVVFCDLVLNDFKIKEDRGDRSLAVFGNYIKVKLYRRAQWHLQTMLKKRGWTKEVTTDFTEVAEYMSGSSPSLRTARSIEFSSELSEAIIANSMQIDDIVLDKITDEKCKIVLKELIEISYSPSINQREAEIWRSFHLSGMLVGEIGEKFDREGPNGEKPVTKSRVRQIVMATNQRILMEYGKKSALRSSEIAA